jgi:hypothetical protein
MFMCLGLTRVYTDVSQPHVLLAVFAPTAFLGIALAAVAICGRDALKRRLSLSNRIPVSLAVSGLALQRKLSHRDNFLFGFTLLIAVVLGPGVVVRSIQRAGESFLYPIFGNTPLARSIDEMRRMTLFEWQHSFFGFLFLFITGAIVAVWEKAEKYRLHKELFTGAFIVMLQSSMSGKPPLDGHTTVSNVIYILPILGFFGLAYALYLRGYPHREAQEGAFDNLIFTLAWFTALLFCTRAVHRFRELFTPAAVILSAYLEFLFTRENCPCGTTFSHKATHLLMEARDTFRISNRHREDLIHYLQADKSGLHFSTDLNLSVKGVDLNLDASGQLISADINVNGKTVNFEPKPASAGRPVYLFSDDSLKGCVAVAPTRIEHEGKAGSGEKRWNVMYLSELAKNSAMIQLYFLEDRSFQSRQDLQSTVS